MRGSRARFPVGKAVNQSALSSLATVLLDTPSWRAMARRLSPFLWSLWSFSRPTWPWTVPALSRLPEPV